MIIKVRTLMCAAAVLLLSACSTVDARTSAAARVAGDFVAAVQARDGAVACALLSPAAEESLTSNGSPCAKAVLDVGTAGRPRRTQVWGDEAQVRTGSDVVFLMHLKVGWRIRAAGCTAAQDRPYSCDVAA